MINWGVVIALLSALGGIAAVAAGARWLVKQIRDMVQQQAQFLRDWKGIPERPGISHGHPGVLARLYKIEQEFQPNSGHTMRDSLDRIENQLTRHMSDGHGGR